MLPAVTRRPSSACDQSSPHFGKAMRLEQINHALKVSLHILTYIVLSSTLASASYGLDMKLLMVLS